MVTSLNWNSSHWTRSYGAIVREYRISRAVKILTALLLDDFQLKIVFRFDLRRTFRRNERPASQLSFANSRKISIKYSPSSGWEPREWVLCLLWKHCKCKKHKMPHRVRRTLTINGVNYSIIKWKFVDLNGNSFWSFLANFSQIDYEKSFKWIN